MEAKKIVLSDSNTTNSYGFSIDFKTLNLERFKTNSVMLYSHDQEQVIGRWDNIRIEDGKLVAEPIFDTEDALGKEIAGKVERGFLKGCSIGIIIGDFEKTDGKKIAKNVEILEASIVAVPSDRNAIVLYNNEHQKLSQEEIVKLFLNEKEDMKTEKEESNEILLQQKEAEILQLRSERDILLKEKEEAKKLQAKELVEEALKVGKITADKKEDFIKLAETNFELAKSTLDLLQAKTALHGQVTNNNSAKGDRSDWTYLKWSKEDPKGLLRLKQENPNEFERLKNENFK